MLPTVVMALLSLIKYTVKLHSLNRYFSKQLCLSSLSKDTKNLIDGETNAESLDETLPKQVTLLIAQFTAVILAWRNAQRDQHLLH